MKHPILKAENRVVMGKQVKKLRREGVMPANIYGKDMSSTAVQVSLQEFKDLYAEVGETGIIDVTIGDTAHPVLIKNMQMNYQSRTPLHADFFKVNLKEKIKAMVPVSIVGESPAVKDNTGTLLQLLNEIEVEALPEKLPDHIEIDVTTLAQVGDQILVSDLKVDSDVTVTTDPSQGVARIAELVAPEPEPEVEAAEGAEGEVTEGGETAEGSESEEGTSEESTEAKEE